MIDDKRRTSPRQVKTSPTQPQGSPFIKAVPRHRQGPSKSLVDEIKADLNTAKDIRERFKEEMAGLQAGHYLLTGVDNIDAQIHGVGGGQVLTLTGRTGTGKTAFAQNMIRNYLKQSSRSVLFFSLEMGLGQVYKRFTAIQSGEAVVTVVSAYMAENAFKINQIEAAWDKEFERLLVPRRKVALDEIPTYIEQALSETGVAVGLVVIDYLGLLKVPGNSEYDRYSRVATETKSLAGQLGLPIVLISQSNRTAGDGYTEPDLTMARSSGQIEEAADFCIGLFAHPPLGEPKTLCAKILKNREGEVGSVWALDYNWATFQLNAGSTRMTKIMKTTRRKR